MHGRIVHPHAPFHRKRDLDVLRQPPIDAEIEIVHISAPIPRRRNDAVRPAKGVDDIPELVDQRREVWQPAVRDAEALVRRLFDPKQKNTAQSIRKGGIRFPNTLRQAAKRLFRKADAHQILFAALYVPPVCKRTQRQHEQIFGRE